jgi:hypothetical protein
MNETAQKRVVSKVEFDQAVIAARNTYGAAVEKGRHYRRFEDTVRAVLRELGIEVEK